MIQLSISAATTYVRKVLDEFTSIEDIGMLASPDGIDMHKLVEGFAVEAVVKTHNAAPSLYLDGITGVDKRTKDDNKEPVADYDYDVAFDEKGNVATITMEKDTLRLVSLQASDSSYVITSIVPEDSPEGRKQLNIFTRGIPDDPCLVLQKKWAGDYKPIFKYYAFDGADKSQETKTFTLEYIPYPNIEEAIILICPKLEYHVLNEIAGLVLDALSEHDKATMYHKKALEF